MRLPHVLGPDDEGTINVASKKVVKDKPNGVIKLKKPPPKQVKPGNWRDGSVVEGTSHPSVCLPSTYSYLINYVDTKKSRTTESPPTNVGALSPGLIVNQLDENSRETFTTGRPLEDHLNLQQCKHCKKGIIKTAAKNHIAQCLRIKKEKAQRKKEAREARERAKEQAREEEARKNDGDGDGKMDDDSDVDDDGSQKKSTAGKATKKVGGKKPDGEPKGKKRKADGDADKGPKNKKKKEEPKPKVPKPKGISHYDPYDRDMLAISN